MIVIILITFPSFNLYSQNYSTETTSHIVITHPNPTPNNNLIFLLSNQPTQTYTQPPTLTNNQNVHNPLAPPLPPRHNRKLRLQRNLRPPVNRLPGMAEPHHPIAMDILLQQRGRSNTSSNQRRNVPKPR